MGGRSIRTRIELSQSQSRQSKDPVTHLPPQSHCGGSTQSAKLSTINDPKLLPTPGEPVSACETEGQALQAMESTSSDQPRCFPVGGSEIGLPQRQAYFGSWHEVTDGGAVRFEPESNSLNAKVVTQKIQSHTYLHSSTVEVQLKPPNLQQRAQPKLLPIHGEPVSQCEPPSKPWNQHRLTSQDASLKGSWHEVTDGGQFDSNPNRTLSKPKSSIKRSSHTPTSTVPLWRFNSIRQTFNYQRPQTAPHPWGAGELMRTGGASPPHRKTFDQKPIRQKLIPYFPKTSNIIKA
jgi:hypothetical protein